MDNDEGYPVEVEIQNATLNVRINHPPSRPILLGPSSGYTGISYTFTVSSTDPDGDKIRYGFDWNNDGVVDEWSNYYESGVISTASHSWSSPGSYQIKVIAEDEHGLQSDWSDIKSMEISQPPTPNEPPIANFTYEPQSPSILDDVYFYDNSTDIDGYITKWQWDFGDGNTSTEKNPVHRYTKKGNYTVTLKVWDNVGASSSTSRQITVRNIPPSPNFSISLDSPKVNQEVKFKDLSIDADGYIVNWTWDFGDGNISYEKDPVHKFKKSGKYNVTLTVRDNDGDTAKLTKQITVIKRRTSEIGVMGPVLTLVTIILYKLKRRS
ncbi:MAG: PKD domain-containing protein [Armatimonadetes bacterium]|nr:PKD domain-containing protein [Armatimonadota bacterium]